MVSNESNVSINSKNNAERVLKIIVIGNGYVGKTCLLNTYINNQFNSDYQTTV